MKKALLIILLPVLLWQCSPKTASTSAEESGQNILTQQEKEEGWELLFDGKTLTGWRNFKSQSIKPGWSVENGTLTMAKGSKGGDIITEKQFKNYDFTLEWKISKCGNSGIMFNVAEEDKYEKVWHTGPEMQILDNSCHPDAKIETHRAGDLYDMIACSKEVSRPAGEWNKARIRVDQGKTTFWLNETKVVEFEMFTEAWAAMIAESKFKTRSDFGTHKKGHIALQDHSDQVWFRNIKIKEL